MNRWLCDDDDEDEDEEGEGDVEPQVAKHDDRNSTEEQKENEKDNSGDAKPPPLPRKMFAARGPMGGTSTNTNGGPVRGPPSGARLRRNGYYCMHGHFHPKKESLDVPLNVRFSRF